MSRSLVNDVTSDDTSPAAGYLLKELARTCFRILYLIRVSEKTLTSSDECKTIHGLLLKRLAKDAPDVKFKALQAIKYLCQFGRDEFRLGLQRDNDIVRECTRMCCHCAFLISCRFQRSFGSFAWRCAVPKSSGSCKGSSVKCIPSDSNQDTMSAIFDNSARTAQSAPANRIKGYGGGADISSTPPPSGKRFTTSGLFSILVSISLGFAFRISSPKRLHWYL